MNSLDLITVKKTIKDYIDTCGLPKEASRLILKEVLEEVTNEALKDAMKELSEKENAYVCNGQELAGSETKKRSNNRR